MTYRIPDLAEILAVPQNGLVAASTFSGTGGGCLGLRWAGYRVAWANEFMPEARASYKANLTDTRVDPRDIREVTGTELLAGVTQRIGRTVDVGDLDLLEGSPPCTDFSMAGSREKGWGKTKQYMNTAQRVDDLFLEYARLVDEVQPRAFYAENVAGLAAGVARGYLREIVRTLRDCGYLVEARLLDCAQLGVPQRRRRLIVAGIRLDLEPDRIPWPTPHRETFTVRDAIPWLEDTHPGVEPEEAGPSIIDCAIGPEWRKLRPGEQSDRYFSLVRAHPDEPCPTITRSTGGRCTAGVAHPFEPRKFSIPELRRLGGFPDDFRLVGSYMERAERIGLSVPPPLSRALGEALAGPLLEKS